MSTDVERQQQKMREFMSLLPLTLALAGLSGTEGGRYFTDGQLEARATAVRAAYKAARQILIEATR